MPIGRLTRKIQCHDRTSVSTPPRRTPIEPPPDITKPNTPIAFARSPGSVKRLRMSENATAETTAPPMPCTARAPMSIPCVVESPHATEATVKTVMPIRKRRSAPKRAPSRPPRSRNPPNVSMYALTTHASEVCVKPRSARIDGRATFTIVVSSTMRKGIRTDRREHCGDGRLHQGQREERQERLELHLAARAAGGARAGREALRRHARR